MVEPGHSEIARLELLFAVHPEGRVFAHLAEAYRRAGDPERARVLLEAGLARHGDYASAHVVHGRVLLDLGLEQEAEAAFRRVLGLDPENLVALRALGDLARRAGRLEEALGHYERLRAKDPAASGIEEALAAIRAALGGPAETGDEAAGEATAGGLAEEAAEPVAVAVLAPPTADASLDGPGGPGRAASAGDASPGDGSFGGRDGAGYRPESLAMAGDPELEDGGSAPLPDPTVDGGELVTETLADLYLAQGLAARAADLYRQLLAARPGDPQLMERLEQALALRGNGQPAPGRGAAEPPAEPEPAPQRVGPEPSISAYLQHLIAWRAGDPVARVSPADARAPAHRGASGVAARAAAPAAAAGPADEFDALFVPSEIIVEPIPPGAAREERPVADPAVPATACEPATASGPLVSITGLLVGLLEDRDPATAGRNGLACDVATAIGRELDMSDPALASLALAALLQGLGPLALQGRATDGAAANGAALDSARTLEATLALLEGVDLPAGVREAIRYAGHRWDGAGAPGPAGDALPLAARILAVARDFAALASPSGAGRTCRPAAALDELRREAGRRYDPAVVAAFGRLVESRAPVRPGPPPRILIACGRSPTAAMLAVRLRSCGYVPEVVRDAAHAWERLAAIVPDALLLTDAVASGETTRFLARVREDARLAGVPVIVVGADAAERRIELLDAGADACFPADVRLDELRATLAALLRRLEAQRLSRAPRDSGLAAAPGHGRGAFPDAGHPATDTSGPPAESA